jgi:hypothetical protein
LFRRFAVQHCQYYAPSTAGPSLTQPWPLLDPVNADGDVVWPDYVPKEKRLCETTFRKLVPNDIVHVTKPEFSACNKCRDGIEAEAELDRLLNIHRDKCPHCLRGGLSCNGFASYKAGIKGLSALQNKSSNVAFRPFHPTHLLCQVAEYHEHRAYARNQRELFEQDRLNPNSVVIILDFSPYFYKASCFPLLFFFRRSLSHFAVRI